jgi:hypothetical protein
MHAAFIVGVEPPPPAPPVPPEAGEVPPPTPAVVAAGEPACIDPDLPASGAAELPAFAELTRPAAPDVAPAAAEVPPPAAAGAPDIAVFAAAGPWPARSLLEQLTAATTSRRPAASADGRASKDLLIVKSNICLRAPRDNCGFIFRVIVPSDFMHNP